MKFWDTSAILPLCFEEHYTGIIAQLVEEDESIVIWWGSLVECYSAIERVKRDGYLDARSEKQVNDILGVLAAAWTEIEPTGEVRHIARRLLRLHPLRAADAFQLAAALIWAEKNPVDHGFVCLDHRLREAAIREGFALFPELFSG